ncbi:hypothetical protein J1614_001569 [Plenodomus biglobosus]|nr:hypothetical protein J1614_001569 [Plenodomus biglobosus]
MAPDMLDTHLMDTHLMDTHLMDTHLMDTHLMDTHLMDTHLMPLELMETHWWTSHTSSIQLSPSTSLHSPSPILCIMASPGSGDFTFIDSIKVRPPTPNPAVTTERSEAFELIGSMVQETGSFRPSERLAKAKTTLDTVSVSQKRNKKRKASKKWKKRTRPGVSDMTEAQGDQFTSDLWELLQRGIRAFSGEDGDEPQILRTPLEIVDAPHPLELRDYQLAAVRRIMAMVIQGHGGALLSHDMGLGKTLTTIAVLVLLRRNFRTYNLDWATRPSSSFDQRHDIQGNILIIVPKDLLNHWSAQLQAHVAERLVIKVYHGGSQEDRSTQHTMQSLAEADVVLSTYETLRSDGDEMKAAIMSSERIARAPHLGHFPLLVVHWRVIVFEEAHKLCNSDTGNNRAASHLKSLWNLAITGTSFQNDYTDIRSIMNIVKPEPQPQFDMFDMYFLLARKPVDFKYPKLTGALNAVLCLILRAFTLRLKRHDMFDHQMVLSELPAPEVHFIEHALWEIESEPQEIVRPQWDEQFKRARKSKRDNDGAFASEESAEDAKMLLRNLGRARLAAVHLFCMDAGYGESGPTDDPVMQDNVHASDDGPSKDANRISLDDQTLRGLAKKRQCLTQKLRDGNWKSSRLEEAIHRIRAHLDSPTSKIVVFSEFLCALDALSVALDESGFEKHLRFDGTVTDQERDERVAAFHDDPEQRILLITNRSGGLGRSFTAADCVIHLTPCYNPSLTEQCTDRVVRFPQTARVKVYHLYAHDSVEILILRLVRTKRAKYTDLLDPNEAVMAYVCEVAKWPREEFEELMTTARQTAERNAAIAGQPGLVN